MISIRKIFIAVLLVFTASAPLFADVNITPDNFPDQNFRDYILSNLDTDKNEILSDSEINSITLMDVSGKKIDNLAGIENFSALVELYCYSNNLVSLDVSKITGLMLLECDNNKLANLDISKNLELINLECEANNIAELDLSKNINLSYLKCYTQTLYDMRVSRDQDIYNVNISKFVSDLTKITDVTAYDENGNIINGISFDIAGGIITANSYPQSIKYGYNVNYVNDSALSMDVTIIASGYDENIDGQNNYGGGGSGCNLFGGIIYLCAALFAVGRRK